MRWVTQCRPRLATGCHAWAAQRAGAVCTAFVGVVGSTAFEVHDKYPVVHAPAAAHACARRGGCSQALWGNDVGQRSGYLGYMPRLPPRSAIATLGDWVDRIDIRRCTCSHTSLWQSQPFTNSVFTSYVYSNELPTAPHHTTANHTQPPSQSTLLNSPTLPHRWLQFPSRTPQYPAPHCRTACHHSPTPLHFSAKPPACHLHYQKHVQGPAPVPFLCMVVADLAADGGPMHRSTHTVAHPRRGRPRNRPRGARRE